MHRCGRDESMSGALVRSVQLKSGLRIPDRMVAAGAGRFPFRSVSEKTKKHMLMTARMTMPETRALVTEFILNGTRFSRSETHTNKHSASTNAFSSFILYNDILMGKRGSYPAENYSSEFHLSEKRNNHIKLIINSK